MNIYNSHLLQLPFWVWITAAIGVLLLGRFIIWPLFISIVWRVTGVEPRMRTILSQKKSSEVRVGKITEQLAPFLEGFPVDPNKPGCALVFLGQPVDYVYFDPEEGITFVEVKSGDAKLTAAQRMLREHINEGRVRWAEYRVR